MGEDILRELMLIEGEWTASDSGKFIPVETPAKRETVIVEVPRTMDADVDRSGKSAAKAFESWKQMAPWDRGNLMLKIAADIKAQSEDFAKILSMETGNAIRMANDSHYGLAAYVYCHDIGKALRTAHAIESGWIQVNQGLGILPTTSYGDFKQSGIGREYSLLARLDNYTQRKCITVNLQY